MLKVLDNDGGDNDTTADEDAGPTLDELARTGARQMLMTALAVEVAQYVDAHQEARDEDGRRLVVRSDRAQARKVTCGAGTWEVSAPRVNDKCVDAAGQRQRFTSRILPPYMRRSPKVAEVLPILYLRGLSTGDFREALPALLGDDAAGLSATNTARRTAVWEEDCRRLRQAGPGRPRLRVCVGRRHPLQHPARGRPTVYAGDDWRAARWDQGARGPGGRLPREHRELGGRAAGAAAPRDAGGGAVGDGALGFWAAVRDVWPETREFRDWCHKMGNVLDKLPK